MMMIKGRIQFKQMLKQPVKMAGVKKVLAADYVADLLDMIVNDNGKMVLRANPLPVVSDELKQYVEEA